MAKKKATKRSAPRARSGKAAGLPEGYTAIGGFTPFWQPKKAGDTLEGVFGERREIAKKKVRKGEKKTQTIATITQDDGTAFSIGESAMLRPLFENASDGDRVYIEFQGMGKKKPGQNAPRLYKLGIQQ